MAIAVDNVTLLAIAVDKVAMLAIAVVSFCQLPGETHHYPKISFYHLHSMTWPIQNFLYLKRYFNDDMIYSQPLLMHELYYLVFVLIAIQYQNCPLR